MKKLLYFSLAMLLAVACKQTTDTNVKHVVLSEIHGTQEARG